jgi:hypothetical protein
MGIRLAECNDQFLLRLDPAARRAGGKALRTFAEANEEGCEKFERDEQRIFHRELNRLELPYHWHSTAHKTKATVGCTDFIVGVGAVTLWIEFKAPGGRLSPDQERFAELLARQKNRYHLVTSAAAAIELVHFYLI